MTIGVGIEKASNHPLIRHLRAICMSFEEIHTLFAEGYRDLDAILLQNQLIWRREEIINDLQPTKRLIGVLLSVLHRVFCLCAKNRCQ